MSAPGLSLPEQVVLGCRVIALEDVGGAVWGHVSARGAGQTAWMKAGTVAFDEVTERNVVEIDLDGTPVPGSPAELRVPRESPLHTEILRARPEVGAVVHAHPPHAIALAATGRPLRAFSNGAGPFAGGVPTYRRPVALIDTPELGREIAEALGDAPALFHSGHGIVAVGSSVATAVTTAILLERASRLQLLVDGAGGLSPELLAPGDRYLHAQQDAYLIRTWEYLVRRVRRAQVAGGDVPGGDRRI